ncbi:MAG: formylglycine-generating enzyme family protein [Acidobacteriota bacterium]
MRFALLLCLMVPLLAQSPKAPTTPAAAPPVAAKASTAAAARPAPAGAKIRRDPKDGLTYIWVAPGTFALGCPPDDPDCYSWEATPHAVSIRNGFWIGQTEVTQTAYQTVTNVNPSRDRAPGLPVNGVSWYAARSFCASTGKRLPTEDEWEFAARALNPAPIYGPVDTVAWYLGNSLNAPHPVSLKAANKLGLHDMLGNLWEWTEDAYTPIPGMRILRGGGFLNAARDIRVSNRLWASPDSVNRDMGFRCVAD